MSLPTIDCYCSYQNENYGSNALVVEINGITVWFSYITPVAFRIDTGHIIVRQNIWGPTTGKHLNAIDGGDKESRVTSEEFERLWKALIETNY